LELTLTAKVKIMPTPEQQDVLSQTLHAYRLGCEFVSKLVSESKELGHQKLHSLTYRELRSRFHLRSQMAQSVRKTVIARYKSVLGNGHPWTRIRFNKPEFENQRSRYKHMRKRLQQVGTASARRAIRRMGQRENRYMTDVNHRISKALVDRYGEGTLFVIEDLKGIRQATERVRVQDRYETVSWSFYQLRQMIEYKAIRSSAKVIAVDPRYTSQMCPKCQYTDKANRNKKKHYFCCRNCQYSSNDDRIGAMNLQRIGIKYIAEVVE